MYRPFVETDAPVFADIIHACYDAPVDKVPEWWATLGRENVRVFEEDGTVVAGLADIPMGWLQGGSRLSLHGAAGVAVAPEARGRGIARQMMAAYVEELAGRSVPLAALYGSTRALYRSVGYGIAGRTYDATVHTDQFRGVGVRGRGWRRATEADLEAVKALHHRLTLRRGGFDRGSYLWTRIWAFRGDPNTVLVCHRDGAVVAWVALRHEERANDFMAVRLIDHGAADVDALRRVAGMLSTYAAMAPTTVLKCGPEEPLLDLLVENRLENQLFEPWLLRVVRVRDALEQRGWTGAAGSVHVRITDPVLPQNEGPWAIEVEAGQARCEPAQSASISLNIRGLAGLFTAGASVEALRRRGLIEGPPDELRQLQALFAAPGPSINDYF